VIDIINVNYRKIVYDLTCKENERMQEEKISLLPYTRERCHEFYKKYISDPMMTEVEYVYNEERADQYYELKVLDSSRVFFAIACDDVVIGEIQLKRIDTINACATLSIVMAEDKVKNKGYGTEAERLILTYGFETLNLKTIYADTVHRNYRSKHVLEKLGFVHVYDDRLLSYYQLERVKFSLQEIG